MNATHPSRRTRKGRLDPAKGVVRAVLIAGLASTVALTSVPLTAQAANVAPVTIEGKSAVLGLEGDDIEVAGRLTEAVRAALRTRGIGTDQDVGLAELRLTMGCEGDSPVCLAEGGKTLGLDHLIYGHVRSQGGSYAVDILLLEVTEARVTSRVDAVLTDGEVSATNVDAAAEDLAAKLLQESEPPPPPPEPAKGDGSDLVWGKHDAATWKKAGLWTSVSLTVASLGTAIGTTLAIRNGGPIYNELIDAANASLVDDRPGNDIDPNTDGDLCEQARAEPPGPGNEGTVTNAEVTKVCNKGDNVALAATVSWSLTGAFAVSSLVFTTLMFVHREKPGVDAMVRRGLTLGVGPTRGGALVGGSIHF